jgi:hypothetical protein
MGFMFVVTGATEDSRGRNVRLQPGERRQKTQPGGIPVEVTVGLHVVLQLQYAQK